MGTEKIKNMPYLYSEHIVKCKMYRWIDTQIHRQEEEKRVRERERERERERAR